LRRRGDRERAFKRQRTLRLLLNLAYGAVALLVCRLRAFSRRPSGVDVHSGGRRHVQRRHHHGVALPSA
jgi:hypothetical protein